MHNCMGKNVASFLQKLLIDTSISIWENISTEDNNNGDNDMPNVFYVYQSQYGFEIAVYTNAHMKLTDEENKVVRDFMWKTPTFNTQMGAYAYLSEHCK